MSGNIRVLVISKANLMRECLRALLSMHGDFDVLTAIECEIDSIESAALNPPPDVTLVHIPILSVAGLGIITALRRRWPATRILLLSARLYKHLLGTASEAAIHGHILESDSHKELQSAIRCVFNGECYLTPSISGEDVEEPDKLSDREKEVMRLIAAGYRTREIAHRLSLSLKTIEKHRASLMRKLGLRTAAAVAAYAIAHGYVTL
jgi:two-component system, NarL family, response regulator NreC